MFISQRYFLLVAEELNMSSVSKRCFISQQCLSSHVIKLEKYYGVKLFHRKPRLKLTQEGEVVARNLRQIQLLEHNLENELDDIGSGEGGFLRIGLHTSRANILLPQILPKYKSIHPRVIFSIYSNVAREMERMILRGQLDFMIANHPASSSGITTKLLLEESVFLVVSDEVLKKYFPDQYPECKEIFAEGVHIESFKDVPFIMNMETSNMRFFVDNLFAQKGIKPIAAMYTNINEMHYQFSSMNFGVSFCCGMMVKMLSQTLKDKRLNVFPILDYDKKNKIVLAYHEKAYIPQYMHDFIDITEDLFSRIT